MAKSTKLNRNRKKVDILSWCIVYQDGALISFIEHKGWNYNSGDNFYGNQGQCIAKIATLGLDTTLWKERNPDQTLLNN